jgi:hypothetical protein
VAAAAATSTQAASNERELAVATRRSHDERTSSSSPDGAGAAAAESSTAARGKGLLGASTGAARARERGRYKICGTGGAAASGSQRKPRSNASRRIENTARRNRQLVSLRLEQQHDKRSSGGAARLPVRASSRDGDKSQCSNMCSRPNLPCLCCKNIGQEISPSRLRGRTGDNNFIVAEATRDESSDGGTARRCRARAVCNTARARCGGVGMINNKR